MTKEELSKFLLNAYRETKSESSIDDCVGFSLKKKIKISTSDFLKQIEKIKRIPGFTDVFSSCSNDFVVYFGTTSITINTATICTNPNIPKERILDNMSEICFLIINSRFSDLVLFLLNLIKRRS